MLSAFSNNYQKDDSDRIHRSMGKLSTDIPEPQILHHLPSNAAIETPVSTSVASGAAGCLYKIEAVPSNAPLQRSEDRTICEPGYIESTGVAGAVMGALAVLIYRVVMVDHTSSQIDLPTAIALGAIFGCMAGSLLGCVLGTAAHQFRTERYDADNLSAGELDNISAGRSEAHLARLLGAGVYIHPTLRKPQEIRSKAVNMFLAAQIPPPLEHSLSRSQFLEAFPEPATDSGALEPGTKQTRTAASREVRPLDSLQEWKRCNMRYPESEGENGTLKRTRNC